MTTGKVESPGVGSRDELIKTGERIMLKRFVAPLPAGAIHYTRIQRKPSAKTIRGSPRDACREHEIKKDRGEAIETEGKESKGVQ